MAPRPKYTRNEIIDAAFQLAREEGMGSIAARSVGRRLNTSVSPLFTVFDSMEELRTEVIRKAWKQFINYMSDVREYTPAFKEYGLRWVRFAKAEPQLYSLLFLNGRNESDLYGFYSEELAGILIPLIDDIAETYELNRTDAEQLLSQMTIHANGIAALCANDPDAFTDKQVSASLSRVCVGLAVTLKLRDGSFNLFKARAMADSVTSAAEPRREGKAPIEIQADVRLADSNNFYIYSLDNFDRHHSANSIYVFKSGELRTLKSPVHKDWTFKKKREVAQEILSSEYITYCAYEGSRVVGFISLEQSDRLVVKNIQVSRDCRRRGIGRALIGAALDAAEKLNYPVVSASVTPAADTVDFFIAMGFSPVPSEDLGYASDIEMEYQSDDD